MTLSNDSKKILFKLYHEYRDRYKHGFHRSDSLKFGSADEIREKFFPELPLEDLLDSLLELSRNDFVHAHKASGTIYECELSDYAIATMEKLPKDIILSVVSFISKFDTI